MVSKAIKSFCKETTLSPTKEAKCGNFSLLLKSKCFPLAYPEWKMVFEEKDRKRVFERLKSSKAYFLHIWNKMQHFGGMEYKLKFDSESAYMKLAKIHCPKVYKTLEKYI